MTGLSKKNHHFLSFYAATILYWVPLYAYTSLYTPYLESLGASHKVSGIIIGSYGFMQLILRIPAGILSDRLDKRRIFINLGILFSFMSAFGLLITKNLALILIFRSLAGIAAATWVHFIVLFTAYNDSGKSTESVGTMQALSSTGQVTAMLVGGWLAQIIGIDAAFTFGAIAGLVGLVISFFVAEKKQESSEKLSFNDVITVGRDRLLITVSLFAAVSQVITFSTLYGFTPVFAELLGATKIEMSLLAVFSMVSAGAASFYGCKVLARKIGEKKVIFAGFILMGIFTFVIPFVRNLFVLVITQIFAGVGRGFTLSVLMGLSIKDLPSNKHATAMGFFQAVYALGMFSGPVITGIIGDAFSLKIGFIILAVISIISAFLSWLTVKDKKTGIQV